MRPGSRLLGWPLGVLFNVLLAWSLACMSGQPGVAVNSNCLEGENLEPKVIHTADCKAADPPTLIHRVEPHYPQQVRSQMLEGKVVAEAVLTPEGILEDISVISSPSSTLTTLAVAAFREWRYKPAICRGSGLSVRANLCVSATFKLHRDSKGRIL